MRKLAWFAAACSGAVFGAVYLLPEAMLLPAGALCALAGLTGLFVRGNWRLRVLLLGFGLALGLCWTGVYSALVRAPAQRLAGTEGTVAATVLDWPQENDYSISLLVKLFPEGDGGIRTLLYVSGAEAEDLRPGDGLEVTASFRMADTLAGEPSNYYYAKGVLLIANAGEAWTAKPAESVPLWALPAWFGKALKDSVASCFPDSTAPLVTALLTGDKTGLPESQYAALRRSGLAHVIAVSGLHVSFLAGFIATLLGCRRRLSAAVTIGLLFFFAAAAGNTPSVTRAACMQALLLIAPLVDRENDPPTALATVLMLLLMFNPYAAASVSLQLSFAAVAGIFLFTGFLNRRWTDKLPHKPKGFWPRLRNRCARLFFASLATTLGAMVFTTPLMAWYFGTVSLISPLTNLLALWAVSYAFLGGLMTALAGLVLPAVGTALGWVASLPVWYLLWLVSGLSGLPFASVSTTSVYLGLWMALTYGLLFLWLLWRGRRGRPVLPVCLSLAGLCLALVLQAAALTGGRLSVSVLDVGQGLSVALYSKGKTALIDCGGYDAGEVAADHFQAMGLSRIDLVILTHYHDDHASGIPQLLERMEVGLLILPDVEPDSPLRAQVLAAAEAGGVETLLVSDGARAELGEALLTIYPPLGDGGSNEEGLSILGTAGDFDLLVTGDMNDTVEGRLVKYGALPDIELLVVGHHGSKYASSETLLQAAAPELAVISVGYNTYGHPAAETLERLTLAGCEIYRTDWSGTVTITAE
ncbi:DNA internalization-related competence protein ComEC/Rec2 [Pseudoflavonifractor phocaeensis]|uniref:DNA internalization-related competence protein ComEC/Rec2 n=1 Tax=Pseudoflavonifractor phocaeensis TaxID=1870988 RepID=UPI00195C8D74|nr:DNA internalization-related competence protein ComEC/Rec2 [Pseudoflavonifractor phocaeensis]